MLFRSIVAFGCPLDLYVVTRNIGVGIPIINSFQSNPKFFENSPYVPFIDSGISLYWNFIFSSILFFKTIPKLLHLNILILTKMGCKFYKLIYHQNFKFKLDVTICDIQCASYFSLPITLSQTTKSKTHLLLLLPERKVSYH